MRMMHPEEVQEAIDEAVSEETWPLNERIKELEAELKNAQEQAAELDRDLAVAEEHKEDTEDMIADAYSRGLTDGAAELEPMRPILDALHKLIEGSDTAQYDPATNTLHLGLATFAALGDETILRALYDAALAFTGETP